MALPLAVNSSWQLTIQGTCLGQRILNILYYRVSQVAAGTTTDQMADAFNTWWGAVGPGGTTPDSAFRAMMPTNYTLDQIVVQQIFAQRLVRKPYIKATAGTYAHTTDTVNVAFVITKRTALAGKANRGSFHGMLCTENAMLNGSVTAAFGLIVADWQGHMLRSVPGPTTTLADPIIGSKNNLGQAQVVNATELQTSVRVMRRRTLGLGI